MAGDLKLNEKIIQLVIHDNEILGLSDSGRVFGSIPSSYPTDLVKHKWVLLIDGLKESFKKF